MNCDIELHEGLIELGDIVCPFCNNELDSNEKPRDYSVKYDSCWLDFNGVALPVTNKESNALD